MSSKIGIKAKRNYISPVSREISIILPVIMDGTSTTVPKPGGNVDDEGDIILAPGYRHNLWGDE